VCLKTSTVDGIPLGRVTGLRKIHVQQQQQYIIIIYFANNYDVRYTRGTPYTQYNLQYYYDVNDIDGRCPIEEVCYTRIIGIPTVYFIAASLSVDDDDYDDDST